MKKLRLLLLPLAAIVELVLIGVTALLLPLSQAGARRVVGWAERLPDVQWYLGGSINPTVTRPGPEKD